jgi:menaquinone-dependent protoporphyrinogen oxidase
MVRTLILYSTTDGQTLKICRHLQTAIEAISGEKAVLASLKDGAPQDWPAYERIVIGASIRYGHHGKEVLAFMKRNAALLEAKGAAFFSVNLVARKPAKCQPDTNPYLRKFLRKLPWRPEKLAVFAGKLDYPSYTPFDRWIIRLIMGMTGGPTDPRSVVEFTDWRKVDEFAAKILEQAAT